MLTPQEKADFQKSIDTLKKNDKKKNFNDKKEKRNKNYLISTIHYGIEFGIIIFIFVWLGKKADEIFLTHPWGFLLISFGGFFIALFRLIQSASKHSK